MKDRLGAGWPDDTMNRRTFIKLGVKVLPGLAFVGLAVTATPQPARGDCFPANCKAICAGSCDNNCTGDCMGSCSGACGGCDNTCTHSNG